MDFIYIFNSTSFDGSHCAFWVLHTDDHTQPTRSWNCFGVCLRAKGILVKSEGMFNQRLPKKQISNKCMHCMCEGQWIDMIGGSRGIWLYAITLKCESRGCAPIDQTCQGDDSYKWAPHSWSGKFWHTFLIQHFTSINFFAKLANVWCGGLDGQLK